MMIPKGYETAAAGQMPEAKAVAAMMMIEVRQVQELADFNRRKGIRDGPPQ